jgi:radical SAM superfamily enzyme YgiQ (UPF0313 family)
MSARGLKKWLIINYAGFPYTPNSLMPDNGLANLAGTLIRENKLVKILDYSTINTIRNLTTPELTRALKDLLHGSIGIGKKAESQKSDMVRLLKKYEEIRNEKQRQYVRILCDEIARDIKINKVDSVGLKLWNGDGLQGSLRIANYIKRKYPKIKVFGGGPQVDVFMDKIAEYDCFDAVAYGDGEETIRYLAEIGDNIEKYKEIPNLLYKQHGKIRQTETRYIDDLDALPMPAYDPEIYPAMGTNEKIKIAVIDESRGCTGNCSFCIHPVKSNNIIREKSVPRLIREIEVLVKRNNIKAFRFAGSCTPYRLLADIAREIIKRNIKVKYSSFAHAINTDKFDFKKLRKSGCLALFFGIESGSQRILNLMHKALKISNSPETIRRANEAGIFTVGSFIYPAPGEDEASEKETYKFIMDNKLAALTVQSPIVIPCTGWFQHANDYGIKIQDKAKYISDLLKWKVKFLLPTTFWEALPISINRKSYSDVLKCTTEFVGSLENEGFLTSITDEMYLMSDLLNSRIIDFRNQAREIFFVADVKKIEEMVSRINN